MSEVLKLEPRTMTKEQRWEWFLREKLNGGVIPPAKPKPKPTVTVTVEPETAERVKARPESVRMSTVREDDIPVMERVRPREIVQPLEVDGEGRVSRARVVDCATGEAGIVDYRNGYRQGPGVVSDYNPVDALKRD